MSNGREDFRVAAGLVRHAKTRRLIRLCGFEGFYRLLCLWSYATENHVDGVFPEEDDIELAADWPGQPGKLVAALKECGFLDPDGRTVHDWLIEQPYVASRPERIATAQELGRRGGLASAEARRKKLGNAQPRRKPTTPRSASRAPRSASEPLQVKQSGELRPDADDSSSRSGSEAAPKLPALPGPSRPFTFEPAVPVVDRPPSGQAAPPGALPPEPPTAGTAGTTGSSAPPPHGKGRNGVNGPQGSPAPSDVAVADPPSENATAAGCRARSATLERESDPPPGRLPADPTSLPAILRDLAVEDLVDPKRFAPFFHRLRRAGKAPDPERQLPSHFALALECARVADRPVAMFIARIQEGDWSKLKPDDFAAAELALGARDRGSEAENVRVEEAAEKAIGGRLPKNLPDNLRDRLRASTPGTREFIEVNNAIAAWRNEHAPGPIRVDPDRVGITADAFLERVRNRRSADA